MAGMGDFMVQSGDTRFAPTFHLMDGIMLHHLDLLINPLGILLRILLSGIQTRLDRIHQ